MKKVTFIIYNNPFDEDERALVDANTERVLLVGDYYHDKISEKMDGYIQAYQDLGYEVSDNRGNPKLSHLSCFVIKEED